MMRTRSLGSMIAALALAACGGGEQGTMGAGGAGGTAPVPIAEHTFGDFGPWATPIEDYKAVGEAELPGQYDQSINELMPFGGRLWLGYGDGTYNMGTYTPIEFRSFASAGDPMATPAVVNGAGEGAPQDTPYRSGEEQIDRYRLCDGELYQAGVDSIDADELDTQAHTNPKGIEGNAYRLIGDTWKKYRSIVGGEHVHDLAAWQGALYGVGSGADFRTEFEAGQIFRYLWRSDDQAATFTTVERVMHPMPGTGDTRFVHLLPTTARLYAFGYESDFQSGSASIRNASYDGTALTPLAAADSLAKVFALGTAPLPDGTGLVYGVDVSTATLRYAIWHVAADGLATKLDAFAGQRVVDVGVYPDTEELLFLTYAGDAYPGPANPASYDATVLVSPFDATAPLEIATYSSAVPPLAIAYWQDALFLGTGVGEVWKTP